MTKVNIISGFLGAGKTTLIKKLLGGAFEGEKVVLLENEYGEVGIDGGFMKDSGIQITELNSGCICCTLVGDFTKARAELIDTYHPDRIIIEPSGVGKLSDIRKVVMDAAETHEVELKGCATVADVSKCRLYMKNFGEFFNDQIESAETIILSRTQTASADRIEKAVALLRERNERARIVTTPWDELDAAKMLETIETPDFLLTVEELFHDDHHHHDHGEECTCGCGGHHHHGHHADEVFQNIGVETPKKFEESAIREALEQLDDDHRFGSILRAKGILPLTDGKWLHFDYVPGEYEIRYGAADYTGRLCVIGVKIDEHELKELFGI